MNVPADATEPTHTPETVWKWKIIRQWRASRPFTLAQIISLTVGLVILAWLWAPPNDGVTTLFMQVFITIVYAWAVVFLFGPYRSTRTPNGKVTTTRRDQ